MSDFIELVQQILFLPFESKLEDTYNKIEEKPRKGLRIFWKILFWVILGIVFLACYCCLHFLFTGRWFY